MGVAQKGQQEHRANAHGYEDSPNNQGSPKQEMLKAVQRPSTGCHGGTSSQFQDDRDAWLTP
jgi:hypothetical protein